MKFGAMIGLRATHRYIYAGDAEPAFAGSR